MTENDKTIATVSLSSQFPLGSVCTFGAALQQDHDRTKRDTH